MKASRPQNLRLMKDARRKAIVTAWRSLGEPVIGAHELLLIQEALEKLLSINNVPGPASIARELALAGGKLRHPEIIECDAHWREANITKQLGRLKAVFRLLSDDALRLTEAEQLILKLERLRTRFEKTADDSASAELKALAIEARQKAAQRAKDLALSAALRQEQGEIADWLMVWLQTPKLFSDWLELRKASPAFQRQFTATPH